MKKIKTPADIQLLYSDKPIINTKYTPIPLPEIIEKIRRDPNLKNIVKKIRLSKSESQQKKLKKELPSILGSILDPPIRLAKYFIYTNIFIFDLDKISENDVDIYKKIRSDPQTLFLYKTPRYGIRFAILLDKDIIENHNEIYDLVVEKLNKRFNINLDRTKSPASAFFLSYDPDAYLSTKLPKKFAVGPLIKKAHEFINQRTEKFDGDIDEKEISELFNKALTSDRFFELITTSEQNPAGRDNWIMLAMSLNHSENGEDIFTELSMANPNYEEDEEIIREKFRELNKSPKEKVHINTFYWLIKEAGISLNCKSVNNNIKKPKSKNETNPVQSDYYENELWESAIENDLVIEPLLSINGVRIIHPYTVNMIQGAAGSNKSFLAGTITSILINSHNPFNLLNGVVNPNYENTVVLYIDTERSRRKEYPQFIRVTTDNAGLDITKKIPTNFKPKSFTDIPRADRRDKVIEVIKDYKEENRGKHVMIILDVITDLVSNFNDIKESSELLDYLKESTEKEEITILGIIHENPGTDKARGHTGTEMLNKSSCVLGIEYADKKNKDSQLLKLKVLKNRLIPRQPEIYIIRSSDGTKLQLANFGEIERTVGDNKDLFEISNWMCKRVSGYVVQKDLITMISVHFNFSSTKAQKILEELSIFPQAFNYYNKKLVIKGGGVRGKVKTYSIKNLALKT